MNKNLNKRMNSIMLNVILVEENPSLKDLMLMELNELFPRKFWLGRRQLKLLTT